TAGDDDVEAAPHAGPQEIGGALGHRPEADQVRLLERVDGELTNRQEGPSDRQRGDDGVDTGAVGETGVHHRGGLVHAAADLAHDLVDDPPEVDVVDEVDVGLEDLAGLLVVDVVGPVGHDLGYVGVVEKGVDGTVTEDVGGDLVEQLAPVGRGEGHPLFLVDGPLQHLHDAEAQL